MMQNLFENFVNITLIFVYRSITNGTFNLCEKLYDAKPEYKEMIKLFGLPDKCPAGKV